MRSSIRRTARTRRSTMASGRDVFGQKWITHHGHSSSTDVRDCRGEPRSSDSARRGAVSCHVVALSRGADRRDRQHGAARGDNGELEPRETFRSVSADAAGGVDAPVQRRARLLHHARAPRGFRAGVDAAAAGQRDSTGRSGATCRRRARASTPWARGRRRRASISARTDKIEAASLAARTRGAGPGSSRIAARRPTRRRTPCRRSCSPPSRARRGWNSICR